MKIESTEVTIRKLIPEEGKIITDKDTQTLKSHLVYLGKEDSENNYLEIDDLEEDDDNE